MESGEVLLGLAEWFFFFGDLENTKTSVAKSLRGKEWNGRVVLG